MLKVTPNLHFRGQGKQAIELYKQVFGAEVKVLLCNSDANPKDCETNVATQNDLVYHAEIYIDGATIIYPMQSTTYSSCFVSLVDKFGMRWELMTEQTEK